MFMIRTKARLIWDITMIMRLPSMPPQATTRLSRVLTTAPDQLITGVMRLEPVNALDVRYARTRGVL